MAAVAHLCLYWVLGLGLLAVVVQGDVTTRNHLVLNSGRKGMEKQAEKVRGDNFKDSNPAFACAISSPTETFQFEGTIYTFYAQKVNWLEAYTICRATRSHLTVVYNKARADFLAKSISEAQIPYTNLWIGGKLTKGYWAWVHGGHQLPQRKNSEGYPPWMNVPTLRGRNCLALERKNYDLPLFVDFHCHLQKPFICEKSVMDAIDNYPQMGINMVHGGKTYIAYHARVTWEEALAFCRQTGSILATIPNMKTAYFVVGMMRRSRPELEVVWIGGQYLFDEWIWLSSDTTIPNVTSLKDGFPPWKDHSFKHTLGKDCLILDHHACKHDSLGHHLGIHARHDVCEEPAFLDSDCSRRKAFICERVTARREKPVIAGVYRNTTYGIMTENKTWEGAVADCKKRNMSLAVLDTSAKLNFVVAMTSEESENVNHLWLGARLSVEKDMWLWNDNTTLPGGTRKKGGDTENSFEYGSDSGMANYLDYTEPGTNPAAESSTEAFPPWCPQKPGDDQEHDCLNLDRGENNHGMFYSMDCALEQQYVCQGPVLGPNTTNSTTIYILQRKYVSFEVAQAVCERKSMTLAIVNTMYEVQKISPVIPEDQDVWLGATRENEHWTWAKTGESIPDHAGRDGYPPWDSMYTNVGKQCLAMSVAEDWSRVFVEQPCKNELWFICQQ